jgi:hypothetical protein
MKSQKNIYSRDVYGLAFCIFFLILGGAIWWASMTYSDLGAIFPRTIASLLILLSATYIVRVIVWPKEVEYDFDGSNIRRILLFLTLVIWAFTLEVFGFLTTSIVGFILILLISNYDKWTFKRALGLVLSGLSVLIALYIVFKLLLNVPLPTGMFL